jgi:diaminopimelate decarboxylase
MHNQKDAKQVEWIGVIDIQHLINAFGSPAWIVSGEQLKKNVADIASFTGFYHHIYYPIKNNPSLSVLQLLASYKLTYCCDARMVESIIFVL